MCDRGDAVAHGQIAEIEEAGDGAEEWRSGGAEERTRAERLPPQGSLMV